SARESAGGALPKGITSGRIENQIAEGGDTAADGRRRRAAAGKASRPAGNYQSYLIAVVAREQVTVRIEHVNFHREGDSRAGSRVARLNAETQMVRRRRADRNAVAAPGDRTRTG